MAPEETETAFESTRPWLVLFFWILLSLAGAASYLLWSFSNLIEVILTQGPARPLPPITSFFFHHRIGVMLSPLPWAIVAIGAIIRGRMATRNLIAFSSSLILSLVVLTILMGLAFTVPWIDVIKMMGSNR
jgi:hypothetical protein